MEQEIAAGHGGRTLGELLPVDVPNPLLTTENFPHLHMDHPLDVALRRMAHSKLNVLPVVGRADIRDLKGVVSLQDILQAYGVAGEKGKAHAASEEIRASRRLVPGVIAAGLAVVLVIGFLNYYYRSARSQRAEEYYKTGNELLQQDRDDEAVQQFRDALSGAPGKHAVPAGVGARAAERQPSGGSFGLFECAVEARSGECASESGRRRESQPRRARPRMPWSFIAGRSMARGRRVRSRAGCKRVSNWRRYWKRPGRGPRPSPSCWRPWDRRQRDASVKKEIGQMLLSYGAPREAADVFRNVAQADDRDADAYAGLGEAELAMENYHGCPRRVSEERATESDGPSQ